MRSLLLLGLFAVLAQGDSTPAPSGSRALPWLHNLDDVISVDVGDPLITLAMDTQVDPSCDEVLPVGLALVANVAPAAGPETILASFAHGVMVYGHEGELIASTPGYPCAGSADEIEVLAAGTAFGIPTIAIAVTTGGRREQMTWLGLFRVGPHGRLDPVFAGAVELREDGIVRKGSVTILPDGLLVRDPLGGVGFWLFDETARVYLPRGGFAGTEIPHS